MCALVLLVWMRCSADIRTVQDGDAAPETFITACVWIAFDRATLTCRQAEIL